MKRVHIIVGVLVAVLAVGGFAWAVQEPMIHATWTFQSTRSLAGAERAALERCEDPGWTGISRVLEQDLDVPCPGLWYATTLAGHLDERTTSWVTPFAQDPQRSPRTRLRAATARLVAGQPPAPELSLLVTDPALPEGVTEAYVDALVEGRLPGDWADPVLRDRVALRLLEAGDLTEAPRVEDLLRLAAVRPARSTAEERAHRVELVLEQAGLGGGRLQRLADRRRRGLSWQGAPPDLAVILDRHRGACDEPSAPACVTLAAELLGLVHAGGGSAGAEHPEALLPLPLWQVLYDGHPRAIQAAARRLGALGRWARQAPEGARGRRLLGALAWPRSDYGPAEVRAGRVGDPVAALPLRRATPWTTALAALAAGEVAGLEVTVRALGEGVVLEAEGRRVAVGACGVPAPLPEQLGPAWPGRAVLAQAVLEAAGAAVRSDDGLLAARLGSLAERLDPIGAGGVGAALASDLDLPPLAMELGRAVASAPGETLEGADVARRQRAAQVLEGLGAIAEGTACPAVLGR